jgi:hypothetical protein
MRLRRSRPAGAGKLRLTALAQYQLRGELKQVRRIQREIHR